MSVVIVTGLAGLIGSESVKRFAGEGFEVIGIDNDPRQWFFGKEASAPANRQKPVSSLPNYHYPGWRFRHGLNAILNEIHAVCRG